MLQDELIKKMTIEDLERANAYAEDLTRGLQIVRSFPQGVTIFGSARLPQDSKYCKMAFDLGHLLAENGHAVITGGGPGIMEAASHGAYEIGGRVVFCLGRVFKVLASTFVLQGETFVGDILNFP